VARMRTVAAGGNCRAKTAGFAGNHGRSRPQRR
jgi:hypothetical protein